MKYLFIVDYEDDAERKRIDYLLEKWQERARISKPRGLTFIIDTEDVSEFAEELLSKLSPDSSKKVKVFSLHERDLQANIQPNELVLEYHSKESAEVVKKLLEYIFSKNNIRYYSSDIRSAKYFTLTRKGRVDIELTLKPEGRETKIKLVLSGYGDAVDYIGKKLGEEIESLMGV